MAKGRKPAKTLKEKVEECQKKIEEYEKKIEILTNKKKELNCLIANEEREELYQAIVESGKSMEEVISLIKQSEQHKIQEGEDIEEDKDTQKDKDMEKEEIEQK